MIIERSAGPKRIEIDGDDADTPLEAILPAEPPAEVCLLRDSPFRILRVSRSGWVKCRCGAAILQSEEPRQFPQRDL